MQGEILDYSVQTNAGVISGEDGNRYTFAGSEWQESSFPERGMWVDFEARNNAALSIYWLEGGAAGSSSRSKVAAGLLAIFLGGLGIHKFYLGYLGPGLIILGLWTLGFSMEFFWRSSLFGPFSDIGILIWFLLVLIALIEGVIYLTKSNEEFEELYIRQRRDWF